MFFRQKVCGSHICTPVATPWWWDWEEYFLIQLGEVSGLGCAKVQALSAPRGRLLGVYQRGQGQDMGEPDSVPFVKTCPGVDAEEWKEWYPAGIFCNVARHTCQKQS